MNRKLKFKGRLRLYFQMPVWFGILLAATDVAIYTIDVSAGILLSGFTLIYLISFLFLEHFNRPVIMNELVSFATQYGQIQKKLLRDLELPNALLDESGRIIWANKAFQQIAGREKPENKTIYNIFSAITKDKLPGGEQDETEMDFQQNDRDFHVKMKRIPLAEMVENSDIFESDEVYEGCLIAIYLFDETALKIALRENDNQSLAVGLLYIDNYEEALDSVEEVRRSLLTALIERKVNKYFASIDGIVRKMEKDKFFFILRKQSLKTLQENRFDLLEDVKTVNIGNEMSVTLSIGVGVGGLTYAQNYEYARTSIDLALGRGGDQAVVKTKEGVSYYGGKSQRVEKNTRVKARVKAHALKEIITSKDRVIVMGHRMTDVDSFGAAVGIYRIAKTLGRSANIVINDVSTSIKPMVDHFISHEDGEELILVNSAQAVELAGANTCLVVVDVNKPSITECPELLKQCRSIVVLDHHRQSEEVIENATLSYIESYASSACEMVTEVIQYIESGLKLKSAEADCLYGGIVIDTNNFTSKAGVRTFEAAAYLRRNGADVTRVRKMFRDDVLDYRAKAAAVSKAVIFKDVFAISACEPGEAQNPTIVGAQAANELLNITGIKASFVLTDYNQVIYISARSIDEINVQIIMEKLGGGGHLNVAAAQLRDVSLEEATEQLKATLTAMLEEGEI
ncbi:MAG: DHH family phosphoesterase [Lachnospiraceae bacterium]|nr:DHH family phosphoesterase [Lachnospiraceae bacterium]